MSKVDEYTNAKNRVGLHQNLNNVVPIQEPRKLSINSCCSLVLSAYVLKDQLYCDEKGNRKQAQCKSTHVAKKVQGFVAKRLKVRIYRARILLTKSKVSVVKRVGR